MPVEIYNKAWETVNAAFEVPVLWFRENVVMRYRKDQEPPAFYHQKFRRVAEIDQCYTDDVVCIQEANEQFKRDRMVDNEILIVLRERKEDCLYYEGAEADTKCQQVREDYESAVENWFTKYGDLGFYGDAEKAYMKQKHRMLWERRHGPVGTGRKD